MGKDKWKKDKGASKLENTAKTSTFRTKPNSLSTSSEDEGLLSWESGEHQVDLEKELATLTEQAPEGEEARYGERLIQFASENLVTEILIHPQMNTLMQCMRNLLSSFTRHRHLVHAGYTFAGNGSWVMQDGTFSLADFTDAYQENEVQRVIRAYENSISIDIHCSTSGGGEWARLPEQSFVKYCKIRVNPTDILDSGSKAIKDFISYLEPYIVPASLEQLLVSSEVVGNIRFSHPTLYVFPGGQGDAALFGINGFNMLVDGGFSRKACWWDFARHLDRLDAVLFTRLNNCSASGMASVLRRKASANVYPQIGHFFCNLEERRALASPDGDKDLDPLLVSLLQTGSDMMADLRHLNLRPQHCYRSPDPINLYHKVGHGTLDMYVLNPSKDSKYVREFLKKWHNSEQKLFEGASASGQFNFPIPNLVSICALLVWRPANPDDTITRIMFPGSTPQHKIFEGLEKLRHLEFLQHPTCTGRQVQAQLPPATTTATTLSATKTTKSTTKTSKERTIITEKTKDEKIVEPEPPPKEKEFKDETDSKNILDNKLLSEIVDGEDKKIESVLKDTITARAETTLDDKIAHYESTVIDSLSKKKDLRKKVADKKTRRIDKTEDVKDSVVKSADTKKIESESKAKTEAKKKVESRTKTESMTSMTRNKISHRTSQKPSEKKIVATTIDKKVTSEDKKSPPMTPKKTLESKASPITAQSIVKERVKTKTRKLSPGSTPAKSTKEAANRRVAESKLKQGSPKRDVTQKSTEKKEPKKREPISRRPRPLASPVKGLKAMKSPTKSVKSIKADTSKLKGLQRVNYEDILRDAKKSDEDTSKSLDDIKQQELDEREEQEIVREIEAVFNRDSEAEERIEFVGRSDIEKITCMIDDAKTETTADGEFEEEYLIIEKEEVDQYTEDIERESSHEHEGELQKHTKDKEESEKNKDYTVVETDKLEETQTKTETVIESDIKPISSKEHSVTVDEKQDISSEKKTSDSKSGVVKPKDSLELNNVQESQPDEKISTTIESGATTAPTLPEDERIPLDDIKEDHQIEEKHTQEETKEVIPPQSLVDMLKPESTQIITKLDAQPAPIREIVKTPDEVADLPLHEEVDYRTYEEKKTPTEEDKRKPNIGFVQEIKIPKDLPLTLQDTVASDRIKPIEEDVVIQTMQRASHAEVVTVTPGSAPDSPMYHDQMKVSFTPGADLKPVKEYDDTDFGYGQYTEKLRETHITTLDSPMKDDNIIVIEEVPCMPEKIPSIPEDVEKEIEEAQKLEESEKPPVSPKDVEKIVADVAEVLKSDKSLDEIMSEKSPVMLRKSPESLTKTDSTIMNAIEATKMLLSSEQEIKHDSPVEKAHIVTPDLDSLQKELSPARSVTSEEISEISDKTVLSEGKRTKRDAKEDILDTKQSAKETISSLIEPTSLKTETKLSTTLESAKTLEKLEEKMADLKKKETAQNVSYTITAKVPVTDKQSDMLLSKVPEKEPSTEKDDQIISNKNELDLKTSKMPHQVVKKSPVQESGQKDEKYRTKPKSPLSEKEDKKQYISEKESDDEADSEKLKISEDDTKKTVDSAYKLLTDIEREKTQKLDKVKQQAHEILQQSPKDDKKDIGIISDKLDEKQVSLEKDIKKIEGAVVQVFDGTEEILSKEVKLKTSKKDKIDKFMNKLDEKVSATKDFFTGKLFGRKPSVDVSPEKDKEPDMTKATDKQEPFVRPEEKVLRPKAEVLDDKQQDEKIPSAVAKTLTLEKHETEVEPGQLKNEEKHFMKKTSDSTDADSKIPSDQKPTCTAKLDQKLPSPVDEIPSTVDYDEIVPTAIAKSLSLQVNSAKKLSEPEEMFAVYKEETTEVDTKIPSISKDMPQKSVDAVNKKLSQENIEESIVDKADITDGIKLVDKKLSPETKKVPSLMQEMSLKPLERCPSPDSLDELVSSDSLEKLADRIPSPLDKELRPSELDVKAISPLCKPSSPTSVKKLSPEEQSSVQVISKSSSHDRQVLDMFYKNKMSFNDYISLRSVTRDDLQASGIAYDDEDLLVQALETEPVLKDLVPIDTPKITTKSELVKANREDIVIERLIFVKLVSTRFADKQGVVRKIKTITVSFSTDFYSDGRPSTENTESLTSIADVEGEMDITEYLKDYELVSQPEEETKISKASIVSINGRQISRRIITTTIVEQYSLRTIKRSRTKLIVRSIQQDEYPNGSMVAKIGESVTLADGRIDISENRDSNEVNLYGFEKVGEPTEECTTQSLNLVENGLVITRRLIVTTVIQEFYCSTTKVNRTRTIVTTVTEDSLPDGTCIRKSSGKIKFSDKIVEKSPGEKHLTAMTNAMQSIQSTIIDEKASLTVKSTLQGDQKLPLGKEHTPLVDENTPEERQPSLLEYEKSPLDTEPILLAKQESPQEKTPSLTKDDKISVVKEPISSEGEISPLVKEKSPLKESKSSLELEISPPEGKKSSLEKTPSPTKDDKISVDKEPIPSEGEKSSLVKELSPLEVSKTPIEKYISPLEDQKTPLKKSSSPTKDDKLSVDKEPTTAEGEKSSLDREPSPFEDSKSLLEKKISPLDDMKSPLEKAPSPTQDEKISKDKEPTPTEDKKSPLEKAPSPTKDDKISVVKEPTLDEVETSSLDKKPSLLKESKSPLEKEPSPLEDKKSSLEKAPSPTKDEKIFEEEEPTPSDDEKSPLAKVPSPLKESKTSLEKAPSPTEDDKISVDKKPTPSDGQKSSQDKKPSPLEDSKSSLERGISPLEDKKSPLEKAPSPIKGEKISEDKEPTPSEYEKSPLPKEPSSLKESISPLEKEISPLEDKKSPLEKAPSLTKDDKISVVKEPTLAEVETSSLKESKSPLEKEPSPLQDKKSSLEKATPPTKDEKISEDKKPTPSEDELSPLVMEQSLVKESKSSLEMEISPLEDKKSSLEKSPSPIKDDKVYVDKKPTPSEGEETSLGKEPSLLENSKLLLEKEISQLEDKKKPLEKTASPTKDDRDLSVVKEPTLAEVQISSLDKEPSLLKETKSFLEKEPSPLENTKSPLEKAPSPTKDEKIIEEKEPNPTDDEKSPLAKEPSSLKESRSPLEEEISPPEDKQSFLEKARSPTKDDQISVDKEPTASEDQKSSQEKKPSRLEESQSTLEKGISQQEDKKPPLEKAPSPTIDKKISDDKEPTPTEDEKSPLAKKRSPLKESKSPLEKEIPPPEDKQLSFEKAPSPTKDDKISVVTVPAPAEVDTYLDKKSSPLKESKSPLEKEPSPLEDTKSLLEKEPPPTKDGKISEDKEPTPSEDEQLPLAKKPSLLKESKSPIEKEISSPESSPEKAHSPTKDDELSVDKESIPSESEKSSRIKEPFPLRVSKSPLQKEASPIEATQSLVEKASSPTEDDKISVDKEPTPSESQISSLVKEPSALKESKSPLEMEVSPIEGTQSSLHKAPSPIEDDNISVDKEPTPSEGEKSSLDKEPSPLEDSKSLLEKEISPLEDKKSPLEKAPSPTKEEKISENKEPTPSEDKKSPLAKEASPLKESKSPLEKEISPSEDKQSYLAKAPSPTKDDKMSLDKQPSPLKESKSALENEPSPQEDKKSPLEKAPSPTKDEKISKDNEPTPSEDEKSSLDKKPSPRKESKSSLEKETSPSEDKQSSLAKATSPTKDDKISVDKETTPSESQISSLVKEPSALNESKSPLESEVSPIADTQSSLHKTPSRSEDDTLFVDKEPTPSEGEKSSLEKEPSPLKESKSSLEKEPSPQEDKKSPLEKAPSPTKDEKISEDKEPTSYEDEKSPLAREATPLKESKSLLEKETSPSEDKQSSLAKAPSPTTDDKISLDKEPLPMQESKSALEKEPSPQDDKKSPLEKAPSPTKDEKISEDKEPTLSEDEKSPLAKEASPLKESKSPLEKEISPSEDKQLSFAKAPSPTTDDKISLDKEPPPMKESKSALEKEPSPQDDKKSPLEKAPSPTKDEKISEDKEPTPSEDEKSPLAKEASPLKESKSPLGKEISPSVDKQSSLAKAPSPTEDDKMLLEKEPSPLKESKSALEREPSPQEDRKSPLEKAPSPTKDEKISEDKEPTPSEDEKSPLAKEASPLIESKSPLEKEISPPEDKKSSLSKAPSPTKDDTMSLDKEPSPTKEEKLSEDKKLTPTEDEKSPLEKEVSPSEDKQSPLEMAPSPTKDDKISVDREPTPSESEMSSLVKEPSALMESKSPLEREVSPIEGTQSPQEKAPSPTEDDKISVVKEPTPSEDEKSSLDKEPSPLEDSISFLEKEISPLEDKKSPLEKAASPTKDDEMSMVKELTPEGEKSSLDKEPSPLKESKSSLEKELSPQEDKKSPLEKAPSPTKDENISEDKEPTPSEDDKSPLAKEASPLKESKSPLEKEISPPENKQSSQEKATSPTEDDKISVDKKPTLSEGEKLSLVKEPSPLKESISPLEKEVYPIESTQSPVEKASSPFEDKQISEDKEPTSSDDEKSPLAKKPSPLKVSKSPLEKEISQPEDNLSSLEKAPTPTKDEKISVVKEPTPTGVETSSLDKKPSLLKESKSPLEKEPSPLEDKKSPLEKAPSPTKDMKISEDKEPTPSEDEKSILITKLSPMKKSKSPLDKEPSPQDDKKSPLDTAPFPTKDEKISDDKEPTPSEDKKSPLAKEESPLKESKSPLEKGISSPEDKQSSLAKAPSPTKDDKLSVDKESTPSEGEKLSLVKEPSPLKEWISPLEKEVSPIECTQSPLEKASSPFEDKKISEDKEPTPSEDEKSPLSKKPSKLYESKSPLEKEIYQPKDKLSSLEKEPSPTKDSVQHDNKEPSPASSDEIAVSSVKLDEGVLSKVQPDKKAPSSVSYVNIVQSSMRLDEKAISHDPLHDKEASIVKPEEKAPSKVKLYEKAACVVNPDERAASPIQLYEDAAIPVQPEDKTTSSVHLDEKAASAVQHELVSKKSIEELTSVKSVASLELSSSLIPSDTQDDIFVEDDRSPSLIEDDSSPPPAQDFNKTGDNKALQQAEKLNLLTEKTTDLSSKLGLSDETPEKILDKDVTEKSASIHEVIEQVASDTLKDLPDSSFKTSKIRSLTELARETEEMLHQEKQFVSRLHITAIETSASKPHTIKKRSVLEDLVDDKTTSLSTIDSGITDQDSITHTLVHGSSSEDVSKEISLEEKYSFESTEKGDKKKVQVKEDKTYSSYSDSLQSMSKLDHGTCASDNTSVDSTLTLRESSVDMSSHRGKQIGAPTEVISPQEEIPLSEASDSGLHSIPTDVDRASTTLDDFTRSLKDSASNLVESIHKAFENDKVQQGIKTECLESLVVRPDIERVSTPPTVPVSPLPKTPSSFQDVKISDGVQSEVTYDKSDGSEETITKVVHVGEDILTQKISTSTEKVPKVSKTTLPDVEQSESELLTLMQNVGKIKTETDTVTKIIKEGENVVTQTITTVTTKEIISREDGTPQNVKTTIETTTLSKGSDGSTTTSTDTQTLLSECSSSLRSTSQMDIYPKDNVGKEKIDACKETTETLSSLQLKDLNEKTQVDESSFIFKDDSVLSDDSDDNVEDTSIDTDVSKRIIRENNLDIVETVTTTTKKETVKVSENKKIMRTTVETNTTKEHPDGSKDVQKNVEVKTEELIVDSSSNLDKILSNYTEIEKPEETITTKTEEIKLDNDIIKRTIVTRITKTKYVDANLIPRKLKTITAITTTDNYPDGSSRTKVDTSTSLTDIESDSIDSLELQEYSLVENKNEEVETQEKTVTINGKDVLQIVTTTTTKEILSNKDKSKKKLKITIESITETKLPDGMTEVTKDVKVSVSDYEIDTFKNTLQNYEPCNEPKEKVETEIELITENGILIKRKTTITTITQQFVSISEKTKRTQTTVKTVTEDEHPDGSLVTKTSEKVSLFDEVYEVSENGYHSQSEKSSPHRVDDHIIQELAPIKPQDDFTKATLKDDCSEEVKSYKSTSEKESVKSPHEVDLLCSTVTTDVSKPTTVQEFLSAEPDQQQIFTNSEKVETALKDLVPAGDPEESETTETQELKEKDIVIIRTIVTKVVKTKYQSSEGRLCKLKTVLTVTTTDKYPDGSSQTTVEGSTTITDIMDLVATDDYDMNDFQSVGKPKEDSSFNIETIKENDVTIKRKTTIRTVVQDYVSVKNKLKRTKTTVTTITEDEYPDGSVISKTSEKISISDENIELSHPREVKEENEMASANSSNVESVLNELTPGGKEEETESIQTEEIIERGVLIKRSVTTKVVKTKYLDSKGIAKKLKTVTTITTTDQYPDGSQRTMVDTNTSVSDLEVDERKDTQELEGFNIEEKTVSVKTAEKVGTRDSKEVKQNVITTTTEEVLISDDKSKKKLRTTVETITETLLPDGVTEVTKDVRISVSDYDVNTFDENLSGFTAVGKPDEHTTSETETVVEQGVSIMRTTTITTIRQEFENVSSGSKKIKTVVKTVTEDEYPDATVITKKSEKVSIADVSLKTPATEDDVGPSEVYGDDSETIEDTTEDSDVKNEVVQQGSITIKRIVTTKTKRETLSSKDKNIKRVRTTVETTTVDEYPDGSTETTKDVKITISEFQKTSDSNLQAALQGLSSTGKIKTSVDKKTNILSIEGKKITQTVTTYVTKEELKNNNTNEIAVKTVTETVTENAKEDGAVETTKDLRTQITYLPIGTGLDDWSPEELEEIEKQPVAQESKPCLDSLPLLQKIEPQTDAKAKKQRSPVGEVTTDTETFTKVFKEGDNEVNQTITVVTTKEVISPERLKITVETTTVSKSNDGVTKTTKATKTTISEFKEEYEETVDMGDSEKSFSKLSSKTGDLRSSSATSDDFDHPGISSPPSDISSKGSRAATHVWGTESSGMYYSDDDGPGSPSSTKSQVAHSPRSNSSFDLDTKHQEVQDIDDKQDLPSSMLHRDPMSMSIYGQLPEDDSATSSTNSETKTEIHAVEKSVSKMTEDFLTHEKLKSSSKSTTSTKSTKSDSSFLKEADEHFEKAIEEHKKVSGSDVISNITAKYEFDKSSHSSTHHMTTKEESTITLKDLKCESKKMSESSSSKQEMRIEKEEHTSTSHSSKDPIETWGKPLGLPSPIMPPQDGKSTPKKQAVGSAVLNKNKLNQEKSKEAKSRASESPSKKKSPTPVYMELTYVPHHGNSYYSAVEFFKRVRARYYVFSGTEPSKEIYNALLDAKKTWEDKDLEVTIIPTYDTDVLGYWVTENEEALERYKIDLSPSASRCTINLQDHETSCAAYRLEF